MVSIHVKFWLQITSIILFSILVYSTPMFIVYLIEGQIPIEEFIAFVIAPFIVAGSILILAIMRKLDKKATKRWSNCCHAIRPPFDISCNKFKYGVIK